MNRLFSLVALVLGCGLAANAQGRNPWLDSTQVNPSKAPICIVKGVIVNPSELNVDFILSMNVVSNKQTNKWLGHLADNGCVYIEADQRFDVITPRMYKTKKTVPAPVRTIVYMLNGVMISDTLRMSKASIRRVDVLLSTNHTGAPVDTACLSFWTWSDEERGLPKPNNQIRIRGDQTPANERLTRPDRLVIDNSLLLN